MLESRSAHWWGIVVVLLAVHAGLAVDSLWRKSTVYDEATHLPAGLAMVATGEARLNPQHPPLVKLLAGLSAETLEPRLPLSAASYREGREWDFGGEVLYGSGNDPMALLRRGRLPTVGFSLATCLVVFLWTRRRFGAAAGAFSLAIAAFSPVLLAHARWVTMDAAVTAGFLWTLYLWWRALGGEASWRLDAGCGLALGLTLAAKFSGVLLLPSMALTEIAIAGFRGPWRRRLLRWLVVLAAALAVVELCYLDPDPLRYLRDFGRLYADRNPDYAYFLHGDFSASGWWTYFLAAMAVKSTLPELIVLLGALAWIAIDRRGWCDDAVLWLPALVWLAATSWGASNWGVRYVLPLYPALFVLAGGGAAALVRWRRWTVLALGALALVQAGEALEVHPDYLAYFNPIAGGPRGGIRWLDGSNLDWGQDLVRLPVWLEERGVERVRLLYFGTGVPEAFGVPTEPMLPDDWAVAPRPGDYVISAQYLVRGLYQARDRGWHSDWLDRYQPADVLGGTLYLYRFGAPRSETPRRMP